MRYQSAGQKTNLPFRITPGPDEAFTLPFLTTQSVGAMKNHFSEMASVASSAEVFIKASERSGGAVIINPRFGCLPMIIGKDNKPVLMYKFVEVLHELVSLAEIKEELPTLSYQQIEGGITFLRDLAQFNVRGLNIDDEEEKHLEASPEFQQVIKKRFQFGDNSCVHCRVTNCVTKS